MVSLYNTNYLDYYRRLSIDCCVNSQCIHYEESSVLGFGQLINKLIKIVMKRNLNINNFEYRTENQ